jgi:hypothetical protein
MDKKEAMELLKNLKAQAIEAKTILKAARDAEKQARMDAEAAARAVYEENKGIVMRTIGISEYQLKQIEYLIGGGKVARVQSANFHPTHRSESRTARIAAMHSNGMSYEDIHTALCQTETDWDTGNGDTGLYHAIRTYYAKIGHTRRA